MSSVCLDVILHTLFHSANRAVGDISAMDVDASTCFLVSWGQTTIMLDCPLDIQTSMNFMPYSPVVNEQCTSFMDTTETSQVPVTRVAGKVLIQDEPQYQLPQFDSYDMSNVDVVLLSCAQQMLALPYLMMETHFSGKVYATEPTIQFGRQLLLDLSTYTSRVPRSSSGSTGDIPGNIPAFRHPSTDPNLWRRIPDTDTIEECISKMIPVSNGERIKLIGNIMAEPASSGHSIGSCNWLLSHDGLKLAYLGASYIGRPRHPKPLEPAPLQHADVCILSNMSRFPQCNPEHMVRNLLGTIAQTVTQGGCCLIPCNSSGIIHDLLEAVITHLSSINLGTVPVFVVGNSSKSSLAYADIFSNWLCDAKSNRVYLPEWPFEHDQLTKAGYMSSFPSINQDFREAYREPCIIFTDTPSLRCGDAVHFLEKWKDKANNSLIVVDPSFGLEELLAPFQPMAMRPYFYPIDHRLNSQDAVALLRQLRPQQVVLPFHYAQSRHPEVRPVTYQEGVVHELVSSVTLELPSEVRKGFVASELAKSIVPHPVADNTYVAAVNAVVSNRDYEMVLSRPASSVQESSIILGKLQVDKLLGVLAQKNFGNVSVSKDGPEGLVIKVGDDASIFIDEHETAIHTREDDELRGVLRETVLNLLVRL